MKVETSKLKKISTIARERGVSVAYIHKLINKKPKSEYEVILIDGVKFILVK